MDQGFLVIHYQYAKEVLAHFVQLLYGLGQDFLDIQYGLMCCYVFTLWSSCVYTPRSLPILYITYFTNWVKTSWTYSRRRLWLHHLYAGLRIRVELTRIRIRPSKNTRSGLDPTLENQPDPLQQPCMLYAPIFISFFLQHFKPIFIS